MAAVDNFFFYEDEVFRVTRKGTVQFGTVIENSELVSSNDETSEEEFDGDYKMKKGHIRVAWHPSGYTEVISEAKVIMFVIKLMKTSNKNPNANNN